MDEPGEQITVVFSLYVTKLASDCDVKGMGGGGGRIYPPFPTHSPVA